MFEELVILFSTNSDFVSGVLAAISVVAAVITINSFWRGRSSRYIMICSELGISRRSMKTTPKLVSAKKRDKAAI
jgi:hypothetical protein